MQSASAGRLVRAALSADVSSFGAAPCARGNSFLSRRSIGHCALEKPDVPDIAEFSLCAPRDVKDTKDAEEHF
jgi:hypothetical protein